MKHIWSLLISILLGVGQSQAATVDCTHFWIQHLPSGGISTIESHIPVGLDTGPSPFGDDGIYRCKADFNTTTDGLNAYLYIGEVGDASEIIFEKNPLGDHPASISHGIDPSKKTSDTYLRFLPFVVPTSHFIRGKGRYEFSIYYKDIIPGQTGIRSGPPAILNGAELFSRILKDFQKEFIYFLQFLLAIAFLPLVFLSRKISTVRAVSIILLSIFTAALFFSFTAVTRYLLNPVLAIRAHDILLLFVTISGNFAILLFYKRRFPKKRDKILWSFALILALLIAFSCVPSFSLPFLVKVQSLAMLIGGAFLPLHMAIEMANGRIASRVDVDLKDGGVISVLLAKTCIMGWDAANLGVFDGRYSYFTGEFYFLPSLILLIYLEFKNTQSELQFRRNLSHARTELMKTLSSASVEDSFVLTSFAEYLAKICHSQKVSISEALPDKKIRLLGKFGNYPEEKDVLFQLKENSLAVIALKDSKVLMASLPRSLPNPAQEVLFSDYVIVPLKNTEDLPGLLCMTNFERGIFPPFIAERIQVLQAECEILFHLMTSKRDIRSKTRLLQTTRLKVHSLQIESESFFLENFQISEKISEPAFIYGDVVDSVSINELFGGESLRKVIDAQLKEIFLNNREHGLILSRDRGDSVSIVFPNQSNDTSSCEAAIRAFKVIDSIRSISEKLLDISKRNGISIPIRYRFVLSSGKITLKTDAEFHSGITSFSLLADSAIDEAARIVSNICLPGEFLISENTYSKIKMLNPDVIELPSSRLKGKVNSTKVYCLVKSKNQKKTA